MKRLGVFRCGTAPVAALALVVGCQSSSVTRNDPGKASNPPLVDFAGQGPTAEQAARVHLTVGQLYEGKGDYAAAMAEYTRSLAKDRKVAETYRRLGVVADKQGQFAMAEGYYLEALKLAPGNPAVLNDLGYSYLLARRWPDSERTLKQAALLAPRNRRIQNNLGMLLAHRGRYAEALEHYRVAGSEAEAQNNLGFVCMVDHRWNDARTHFRLALQAQPSLQQARVALHKIDTYLAASGRRPATARSSQDGVLPSSFVSSPRR